MRLSGEDGEFLVRLARRAAETYLNSRRVIDPPKETPSHLRVKAGVFVTINNLTAEGKTLRGCIGLPRPIKPLVEAVIESAINSAVRDPRFSPMRPEELKRVVFEVSVLTPPELIEVDSPLEYPEKIVIGRDGLIIEKGFLSGLLLPQVPVEYGWDAEEYLSHLCMKAGLTPDSWISKDVKVYRFEGVVFEEEAPEGEVARKALT
ncbi:MAG: TIGR00296 family protein [Candidatus Geothermarchaeales archaeon]